MTLPRARLLLEAPGGELEDLLEKFAQGAVVIELVGVELHASDGELRHDLRASSATMIGAGVVPREDLPERRAGPLLRLYATHSPHGGQHG